MDMFSRQNAGYDLDARFSAHLPDKLRLGPMLGFKRFRNASITIAGIELVHRIRKGQFALERLRARGKTAPEIWTAVLAA